MPDLFDAVKIANLKIRNHMMRSATAERMANPQDGTPSKRMQEMYMNLAEGGIGLIITGHAYVEREGIAHPKMSSIASDDMITPWHNVISPASFG